jgi:hypothetical protein
VLLLATGLAGFGPKCLGMLTSVMTGVQRKRPFKTIFQIANVFFEALNKSQNNCRACQNFYA